MTAHPAAAVSRRAFLAAAAALATAPDCDMCGRDDRPHKGFASTRAGSGGQCTTHAARRFDSVTPDPGVNWYGGARLWYERAAAAGLVVSPWLEGACHGAITVCDNRDGVSAPRLFNGHVAFVEALTEEWIEVSEMNWGAACAGQPRWRTSMWGRVAYASLAWHEAAQRGPHRLVGYVYPERLEREPDGPSA